MQEVINVSNKPIKISTIDFNCDLAQSFGVYKNDKEYDLLDYVSSVNVSTGFHAGDPIAIKNALCAVKDKNVVLGAHIGFNDIQGFGSRMMNLTEEEVEAIVIYQVGALMNFAKAYGLEVEHVRPHGAMYKLAAQNFQFSVAIAKAVKKCSKWLTYVGAAGDVLEKTGDFVKLPIAQEIKFNMVYGADGTVDYSQKEISDSEILKRRFQKYIQSSQIANSAGGLSLIKADTIHFSNTSIELAKYANELLIPTPVNYAKVENTGWV